MQNPDTTPLIDWSTFLESRGALGADFTRVYGYFREDAGVAIASIEAAAQRNHMAPLIESAFALSQAADQFGAERLASLAEDIELHARTCLESGQVADDYVDRIVALRPLLAATVEQLDAEVSPLVHRHQRAHG